MNNEEETKNVVIATTNVEKAIFIIAKDAMINDELEIHFTEKYAPTVEYLLRILRKAFGWMEQDRGTKEVKNTKCNYNQQGYCACSKIIIETKNQGKLKCNESTRITCEHYKPRFDNRLTVNYVTIEKAGQIRGM